MGRWRDAQFVEGLVRPVLEVVFQVNAVVLQPVHVVVRNIRANPQVSLVVDHYEENWERLWYILISGTAQLLEEGAERPAAIQILREKYAQYRLMNIDPNPVIKITPSNVVSWGFQA